MPQLPPPDPNEQSRRYSGNKFVEAAILLLIFALVASYLRWSTSPEEMLRLGRGASAMVQRAGRSRALCSTGDVKKFLDAGVDVNVRDRDGSTALHNAAVGGCADTVRLLLERGAHTDIADRRGCTALMLAELRGYRREHTEIAQLLRQAGAADLPKDACCKACSQKK